MSARAGVAGETNDTGPLNYSVRPGESTAFSIKPDYIPTSSSVSPPWCQRRYAPLPAAICFVYRDRPYCPPRSGGRRPSSWRRGRDTRCFRLSLFLNIRRNDFFSFLSAESRPRSSRGERKHGGDGGSERAFPRFSPIKQAISRCPGRPGGSSCRGLSWAAWGSAGRLRENDGILLSDHRACIALTGMISPFCTPTWTRSTRTSAPANRILPLYEYEVNGGGGGGGDDVRGGLPFNGPLCAVPSKCGLKEAAFPKGEIRSWDFRSRPGAISMHGSDMSVVLRAIAQDAGTDDPLGVFRNPCGVWESRQ